MDFRKHELLPSLCYIWWLRYQWLFPRLSLLLDVLTPGCWPDGSSTHVSFLDFLLPWGLFKMSFSKSLGSAFDFVHWLFLPPKWALFCLSKFSLLLLATTLGLFASVTVAGTWFHSGSLFKTSWLTSSSGHWRVEYLFCTTFFAFPWLALICFWV